MSTGELSTDSRAEAARSIRDKYMPQIDGLRAVAVLLVVVHHSIPTVHFGGWLGVNIFFVLSGYLITSLLIAESARTGRINLKRFYLRRALRLYPPLLASLILLLPLGILATGTIKYVLTNGVVVLYLTNLYTTVTGNGIQGWTHTWTLALEEQFYLVWPLLLLLALHLRAKFCTIAVVVAIAGTASLIAGAITFNPDGYNVNPILSMGGLALGCVMAMTKTKWQTLASAWVGAVGGLGIAIAVVMGSTPVGLAWAPVVATGGSVLLIAHLVVSDSALTRVLSLKPAAYIGKISYEVYLWHYPLLAFLAVFLPLWISVPTALVSTLVFSVLSHRYVSAPLNRKFKARLT